MTAVFQEEQAYDDHDSGTNAPDNLQSLCKPCHSRKTAKEQGLGVSAR